WSFEVRVGPPQRTNRKSWFQRPLPLVEVQEAKPPGRVSGRSPGPSSHAAHAALGCIDTSRTAETPHAFSAHEARPVHFPSALLGADRGHGRTDVFDLADAIAAIR